MKHKHYEIGVAKLANKNLVQFIKMGDEWENAGLSDKFISFSEEYEYFLCLPQHEEACLHWLNGGELNIDNGKGLGVGRYTLSIKNNFPLSDFVNHHEYTFIIKPKEEKRWIGVNSSGYATPMTFISEDECKSYISISYQNAPKWQRIEIEVEV